MPSEGGSALRRLGVALLNATLLLLALVLLLLLLLVWQLRGLAGELRQDLAGVQAQIETLAADTRATLQALPDSPQAQAARQELALLVERLEALEPGAPAADGQALWRSLGLGLVLMLLAAGN